MYYVFLVRQLNECWQDISSAVFILGLPLVRFAQGMEMVIKRERFVYKTLAGAVSRVQLPLQLAWAISIHKSQVRSLYFVC